MIRKASSTARIVASHWSNSSDEHPLAERTDGQRGQRHAELHGGDEVRRIARDLDDRARRAAALVGELLHAGSPHGHERVLACDEEAVQQDQRGDGRRARARPSSPARATGRGEPLRKRCVRAPPHGRRYSAASRRPLRRGSIGDASAVLVTPRPALRDEPLEVRQRLRDRESPRRGPEVVAEEREGDLVSRSAARRRARPPSPRGARHGARSAPAHGPPGRRSAPRARAARCGRRGRSSPRARRGSRRAGRDDSAARARRSAMIGSSTWSAATSTPSRTSISWPSAWPGAATARHPSTWSPGSRSSRVGLVADERPPERSLLDQLEHHVVGHARGAGTSRRARRPSRSRPRRGGTARSRRVPGSRARR